MTYIGILGKTIHIINDFIKYANKNRSFEIVFYEKNIFSLKSTYKDVFVQLIIINTFDKMVTLDNIVEVHSMFSDIQIIVVMHVPDYDFILRCIRLGINAILESNLRLSDLLDAIWQCIKGGVMSSVSINKILFEGIYSQKQSDINNLTSRELEVLNCLTEGLSNKLTATRLSIGIETVRTHVKNICRKFSVKSRVEVVCKLLREKSF